MGIPRFSGCRLVLDLEFGHRLVRIVYVMRLIDGAYCSSLNATRTGFLSLLLIMVMDK